MPMAHTHTHLALPSLTCAAIPSFSQLTTTTTTATMEEDQSMEAWRSDDGYPPYPEGIINCPIHDNFALKDFYGIERVQPEALAEGQLYKVGGWVGIEGKCLA